MKNLFLMFFIILYINNLGSSLEQKIKPTDFCDYNDYIFNSFNLRKEISDNIEITNDKVGKSKNSDIIIHIGIFSLTKEIDNYKLDISGCRTKKIIKKKLNFELSIKNVKKKIICTIPKLNSSEIKNFDINCKIKKSEYSILINDIILNNVPDLKGFTFKGFERYIPRGSRKK